MALIVPKFLQDDNHFVVFRLQNGKKFPVQIRDGRSAASSTDQSTWATLLDLAGMHYNRAADFEKGRLVPGFALHKPFVGIDIDHCLDADGRFIDPRTEEFVHRCNTYTEISPSGDGVHLIARLSDWAEFGRKIRAFGTTVEIYTHSRLFTLTGNRYPGTPEDARQFASIDELLRVTGLAGYVAKEHGQRATAELWANMVRKELPERVRSLSDEQLVSELKRVKAWEIDDLKRKADDPDDASSLDFQFGFTAARLGCYDADQIERVARTAPLYAYRRQSRHPNKWDTTRGGVSYWTYTLGRAFEYAASSPVLFLPSQKVRFHRQKSPADSADDGGATQPYAPDSDAHLDDDSVTRRLQSFDAIADTIDDYLGMQAQADELAQLPHYVNRLALGAYVANSYVPTDKGLLDRIVWMSSSGNLVVFSMKDIGGFYTDVIDREAYNLHKIRMAESFIDDEEIIEAAREEVKKVVAENAADGTATPMYERVRAFMAAIPDAPRAKLNKKLTAERDQLWKSIASYIKRYRQSTGYQVEHIRDFFRPNGVYFDRADNTVRLNNNRVLTLPAVVADDLGVVTHAPLSVRTLRDFCDAYDPADYQTDAVRLYKYTAWEHRLDELLDFLACADVAPDTKKSMLFIQAVSDFGKSFFVTHIMQGYFLQIPPAMIPKLAQHATVPISMADAAKASALYVDEVKTIDEASLFAFSSKDISIASKYNPLVTYRFGARLFLSADDFVGESADEQFLNRFSRWQFSTNTFKLFAQNDIPHMQAAREIRRYVWVRLAHAYNKVLSANDPETYAVEYLNRFHHRHKVDVASFDEALLGEVEDYLIDVYTQLLAVEMFHKGTFPGNAPAFTRAFTLIHPKGEKLPILGIRSKKLALDFILSEALSRRHNMRVDELKKVIPYISKPGKPTMAKVWQPDGTKMPTSVKVYRVELPKEKLSDAYARVEADFNAHHNESGLFKQTDTAATPRI